MKTPHLFLRGLGRAAALASFGLVTAAPLTGRVLDDFNDNTKTNWTDFTFVPGFGLPQETGGQFRFEQPAAGQAIFSASQKTSEVFELIEGRTIEFRADLIEGGAKDSFAVLAFIPTAGGGGPGTLAGYGFAKSTTDVLITKGINKYFYNENPDVPVKNDNITLSLTMSVRGGNVVLRTRVYDKDAGDALIFEQTAIDTPAADVLRNGTDDPEAPYITSGYFTLYLYQDFDAGAPEAPYKAYLDNAEVFVTDLAAVDDFNDNTKTNWTDFTFVPGFGLPQETGGQFRFEQPAAGQAIFSASQKTSRVFDLVEGERLEFSVDLVEGGAKDSFAVLAFIPTTGGGGPGTLGGYGFAKSTTDVLITKGINKYFYNEDPATPIKNDNITLSMAMTVRGGNVSINARVLDKDAGDAVIFEETVVDTPAADVFRNGTDDPAAPYITSGFFTLYLYQDFDSGAPEDPYKAYFDNAMAAAPPQAANVAPIISQVLPANFSNFLPAATALSFKVDDDKPLANDKISITLNGTTFTTANGLVVTGAGGTKTASLAGQLVANRDYAAVLAAEDSDGETTTANLYLDTFAANSLVIEVEDYNFDGGQFINAPVLVPEGQGPQPDAYSNQFGFVDVDYSDTRTSPNGTNTMYRFGDPIRMQRSRDYERAKYGDAGGAAAGVYDYDVGDIAAGEWMNYTRNFPIGSYEVYLRESVANMATGESVLELVTGDRTQPNQTVSLRGSFLGQSTGFQYRNFALTDGTGQNKIVLPLGGVTTLRLRHVTPNPADGGRSLTYLLFNKVADVGPQPAAIASLSPTPDSTVETVSPTIRVEIQDRDTSVVNNTIQLRLNGQPLTHQVTDTPEGAVVTASISPLPPSGATQSAQISFRDNQNQEISATWGFIVTYRALDPANRKGGPGSLPGFHLRVVQAPAGSNLENSLGRAEEQLRPNSSIPAAIDAAETAVIINFSKNEGSADGFFPDDIMVPGLGFDNGLDDFVVEAKCYLELTAGIHRFGVVTDDGYKINAGATPSDISGAPLAFHNGGPANETFDFVVPATGLYPFRFLWYERGGSAHAEWFSVDLVTGDRTLINEPAAPAAVKAWQTLGPAVVAETSVDLRLWSPASNAVFEADRVLIPLSGRDRFHRLRNTAGGAAPSITTLAITGGNFVIGFQSQ